MSHCISLWVLVLSLTGTSEASFYPQASWDELVTKLRGVNSVSGQATGLFAWPGYFFILSKAMIRVGKEEDFRALLSDEQAVVRCMGLLALAQVKGKAATPTIRSYLYDSAGIRYCREGCCTLGTTVGHFAWNLLLDANHLEYSKVRAPLLTESEKIGLEIEFLAADLFVGGRIDAATHLPRLIRDGTLMLQWAALKGYAPGLEDYQIIKGIGRLERSVKQRDFLIACLRDKTLDANARLAAGSALTCHTDDVSFGALRRERDLLNSFGGRHWGDQFIETVDARKVHETNMEPIAVERAWWREQAVQVFPPPEGTDEEQDNGPLAAKRTWQGLNEVKDKVVAACTFRHPLALSYLPGSLYWFTIRYDPDVRRALANSLIETSRNLKDYSQPWSTYADSASFLAMDVALERQTEYPEKPILTDSECDEIEKNLAQVRGERQQTEKPPQSAAVVGEGT